MKIRDKIHALIKAHIVIGNLGVGDRIAADKIAELVNGEISKLEKRIKELESK